MSFESSAPELRPIDGYEGIYSVSSDGRVWSHQKRKGRGIHGPRWLSPGVNSVGYCTVVLIHAGTSSCRTVHSLVADAWIGPRPDGHDINHRDGVKTQNAKTNLEYCTRSENVLHGLQLRPRKPRSDRQFTMEQVTQMRSLAADGMRQTEIAKHYGTHKGVVHAIVHNRFYRT